MKKFYYGFRYFSGHSTTTGEPNPLTGRLSVAGELVRFETKTELNNWLEQEKVSAPSGCDGGERISITKAQIFELLCGQTRREILDDLEMGVYDL